MDAKEKQDKKEDTNNVFNLAEQPKTNAMTPSKRPKIIKIVLRTLVVIFVLIIIPFISYGLGRASVINAVKRFNQLTDPNNPMFASLNGTVNGRIVRVDGGKVYVQSLNGGTGVFNLSDQVIVSEVSDGKLKNLGNNKDSIRLNEHSVMQIVGLNGGYTVSSVTYFKDSPNLMPLESTQSASPSARNTTGTNNK